MIWKQTVAEKEEYCLQNKFYVLIKSYDSSYVMKWELKMERAENSKEAILQESEKEENSYFWYLQCFSLSLL